MLADRFRIERLIGNGGMAAVYEATDVLLGRAVAVKVFRGDAAEPERQSGEVSVLASLNHFALVTLYDAGTASIDGVPCAYIVMELVNGHDLRTRIAAGPMPPVEVAQMGADLAEALHYVHARGIIHRDVKPANVLLAPSAFPGRHGQAKLADFGIARLLDGTRMTATGSLLGTASYLSPEQALGEALGAPSDVYSLGLVLLECLTGERVYPGSAIESAMARLQRQPEIPPELGPEWCDILRQMTSRNPAERPDAGTVAVRLRKSAEGSPDTTAPTRALSANAVDTTAATALFPQAGALTPQPAVDATPTSAVPGAPEAPTVATTRIGSSATETVAVAESEGVKPSGSPPRRRWILAAVAVVLAAAVAVGMFLLFTPGPDEGAEPAPSYPAVEGELGEHLKELQDSVEP